MLSVLFFLLSWGWKGNFEAWKMICSPSVFFFCFFLCFYIYFSLALSVLLSILRHLRGLNEAGRKSHQHRPPGVVPQHGWPGWGSCAGTLHWHWSLPAGVWAQRRRLSAAILRRPLPARLQSPHQPRPQRHIAGLRRVCEVVQPWREAVWRGARHPGWSDHSLGGVGEASPSGAASRHRGHQYHRPLTAEPWVQTGSAQDALLSSLPGMDACLRSGRINRNQLKWFPASLIPKVILFFAGLNPVQALHGLLPQRDAGLLGEHGGDWRPLEGVCSLAGGPVSADARASGFRASAAGSSHAASRCCRTRSEKWTPPFGTGQIICGERFIVEDGRSETVQWLCGRWKLVAPVNLTA